MKPKEVLEKWIDCFNKADAYHIAELYATNAVNHQVANEPIIGKESIYKMFVNEFATAKMVCMVENIFEDGEWAIMEWKDSLGLRGCGFFRHYKIFCVNGNTGFRNESRIFYCIHLQNEKDYERKKSSSA